MSATPEIEKCLTYVAGLKRDQEAVILKGLFTRIEEYRAACAVVRNLDRIAVNLRVIAEGGEAVSDGESLQPMPEDQR